MAIRVGIQARCPLLRRLFTHTGKLDLKSGEQWAEAGSAVDLNPTTIRLLHAFVLFSFVPVFLFFRQWIVIASVVASVSSRFLISGGLG